MRAFEFLFLLHTTCFFQSRERDGVATKSELRRWLRNKAVIINGIAVSEFEELTRITSMILFPKSKQRITIQ